MKTTTKTKDRVAILSSDQEGQIQTLAETFIRH